jgi:hypothetical protein
MTVSPAQAATLTAAVSATLPGTPLGPSGTVAFFDNGTQLGAAVNVTNGVGTLIVPSLPSGAVVSITAVYSGDGNFLGATSSNSIGVVVARSTSLSRTQVRARIRRPQERWRRTVLA